MTNEKHLINKTQYMSNIISDLTDNITPRKLKILDFGCGDGKFAKTLGKHGFDVYGTDIKNFWSSNQKIDNSKFKKMNLESYEIPFDENSFDIVCSYSVLEHAQNLETYTKEIHRVLKPKGFTIHWFPSKYYLPYEPHIYVPLANYFWPNVPKWWLAIWAILGVRNEYQSNLSWRDVMNLNYEYCKNGLAYFDFKTYKTISMEVFNNCEFRTDIAVKHAYGKLKLFRGFPFKKLTYFLVRTFRTTIMVQKKLLD